MAEKRQEKMATNLSKATEEIECLKAESIKAKNIRMGRA